MIISKKGSKKRLFFSLFTIVFFFLSNSSFGLPDKKFLKYEEKFLKVGADDKFLKKTKRVLKTAVNATDSIYYIGKKIIALHNIAEFEVLEEELKLLEGINGSVYDQFLKAYLIHEYYIHAGQYLKAYKKLRECENYKTAMDQQDELAYKFSLARVKYLQGYFKESRELLEPLIASYLQLTSSTAKKMAFRKDNKGQFHAHILNARYKVHYHYGMLLTYNVASLREMGDFDRIKELEDPYEDLIYKNIKKYDNSRVEMLFQIALAYTNYSTDIKEKRKKWDECFSLLDGTRKNYLSYSRKNLDFLYARYRIAWRERNEEELEDLAKEFRDRASEKKTRYFKRVSRFLNAGNDYLKGNLLGAERDILKAYKSDEIPESDPIRLEMLESLIDINFIRTDYNFLDSLYTKKLYLASKIYGGQAPRTLKILADYFSLSIEHGDLYTKADSIQQLLDDKWLFQITEGHYRYAEWMNSRAKILALKGKYGKARELYKKNLETVKKYFGEEHGLFLKQKQNLALVELAYGNYILAREYRKGTVENIEKFYGKVTLHHVMALENDAYINSKLSNYYDAFKEYNRAETYYSGLWRRKPSGRNYFQNEKLELLLNTGYYSTAQKEIDDELALLSERYGNNHRELIKPLILKGKLSIIKGIYDQAEPPLDQALKLSERYFGRNSEQYLDAEAGLSSLHLEIGDYKKAYREEKEFYNFVKRNLGINHLKLAQSANRLGLITHRLGMKKNITEDYLMEAKKTLERDIGQDHPLYAKNLKHLGHFYIEQGRGDKVIPMLDEVEEIEVDRYGRNTTQPADLMLLRAEAYNAMGDFKSSKKYYESALRKYKNVFSDEHPTYVQVQSELARNYYDEGDYKSALKLAEETNEKYLNFVDNFFPSLSDKEKNKYWGIISSDFEFFNSLAMKLIDEEPELAEKLYNNALHTKALLLSSSIKVRKNILASSDTILIKAYNKWIFLKEKQVSQLSEPNISTEERNSLQRDIEEIEKSLSKLSNAFADNKKERSIEWKDVQNSLKENEVSVELIRFRTYDNGFTDKVQYAALLINSETKKHPLLIPIPKGNELEGKYIKYYRNSIKFQSKDMYSYKVFWEPVKSKIKDGHKIYVSPEGIYNQINIETLLDSEDKYMIDRNEIILVSNSKEIIRERNTETTDKKLFTKESVLVGNPMFNMGKEVTASFDDLPGAEKEIIKLQKILNKYKFNPNTFLNEHATEDTIKSIQSPPIFHIATHGYFMESADTEDAVLEDVDNPLLRSGLLMTGASHAYSDEPKMLNKQSGILTAYEAMNLNLVNTNLVVLSACETARGEVKIGEGVYGLQRAFLVAGADAIIMSLFKVSDQATVELMELFYEKWLSTGDRRQSFIDAKLAMKEKYKYPIYWGAFNMIGI